MALNSYRNVFAVANRGGSAEAFVDRELFVYVDRAERPVLAGRLWTRGRHGVESATFRYDPAWLADADSFALGPSLPLSEAAYHTAQGEKLFGSLGDSAPDRWGRTLIRRQWRREMRDVAAARTLSEVDFLLRVSDTARLGALRFTDTEGGVFQAPDDVTAIPPLVQLPALLQASDAVLADSDSGHALRLLLAPGSSLGGARPKASVRDTQGQLALAKFPAQSDSWDTVRWEAVALDLARSAGIAVPRYRLEPVQERFVLLLERFDRDARGRIPFLSAMAALGALDHETRSYMEFVDFLRQYGAQPVRDMHALWRRIVFNVLISNVDDHLRNHGFLHEQGCGWTLSPAYDLNPVPVDVKPRILQTTIDLDDATASLDLALEVAPYFELDDAEARSTIAEVAKATANWRQTARSYRLSSNETQRMATAFEHEDLELARRFGRNART